MRRGDDQNIDNEVYHQRCPSAKCLRKLYDDERGTPRISCCHIVEGTKSQECATSQTLCKPLFQGKTIPTSRPQTAPSEDRARHKITQPFLEPQRDQIWQTGSFSSECDARESYNMAEDESLQSVETEERPQTARKDSRKLPGGFDRDDVDDLSPNKATHEDPLLSHVEGSAHNLQKPSFDPAGLPQLPPPGDSSLLYHESNDGKSEVHVDDSAMERHLNDVESSFMPVASPIGLPRHRGADDSYQFDRGATQTRTDSQPSKEEEVITELDNSLPPMSPPTPANAYKTPAPGVEHSSSVGDTTSSLETLSSSPTAAAAARTVSRAISNASAGYNWNDSTSNDNHEQYDSENEAREELDATPRKRKVATIDDSFGSNSLHRQLSNQSLNQYDAGSTPGAALFGNRSSGTRPKFLRSRHSKHSSVSSFITNPESQDGSEATLGADYALQSGGALPAGGLSRNSSMGLGLSRSISLGSMASAIDEDRGDYSGKADGTLETLTEEEQNRRAADASLPSTPRATSRSFVAAAAPTDTIIARHVRNVQVPESLAKEYRNKSGAVTPKIGSSFATSTLGRNGKNLTLKEQSSTIERLSKENFDLKLKVMFLSDRLDKLSEEGVREMISENVELKTGLAVMQRDNKALKRKVKELEKQLKDDEERPSTAISGTSASESPKWFDQEGAQEREEELVYLRERVEEYVTEIEKLRSDSIARENEKRNLAEVVRNMGERRSQNLDAREEMDVWKDLLEQETSRREQTDEDNKRLREEIFRLKTEPGTNGLNHTTNIYNITKKRQISPSRPISGHSNHIDDRTSSAASTLVDELRKETEQLRHENAELRREVGAQTNMLTSRNREKERLYQEIEDLKLGQRRNGGSIAGDSIFERSASRAHQRSLSRTSAGTRQSLMTDTEREELENKNSGLRDSINALKIQNQDLQRELESCMEDFETAVAQKKEAEKLASEMQEALEVAETDLLTMQADRDEALQGQEEAEIMFESLRKEAQEELDGFAAEAEEANVEIERLQTELQDTTENFNALQNEMREMSEALVRLEDDHETKARRIEDLERDLEGANQELEQMEQNLVESNGKVDRFSVQQESAQGEIAFLREEQDGDKIKIGDLEAALKNAERSLQEEGQRAKDLDQRLGNERHQRELIASKEKQEIQQYVNNLNREITNAQDEARRLRKNLQSRETEAAEWKSRLTDLENNLREALGDLNGTRSSMFTVSFVAHDLEYLLTICLVNSQTSVRS